MKKFYLISLILIFTSGLSAQELITGFEFPGGVEEPFNANLGIENNLSYAITMEDMDGNDDYTLILKKGVDGNNDSAVTTSSWDNSEAYKFLSVKFKAADYGHFTVSSQMRSTNNDPGPAHWKVMWRTENGDWADVPGSEFTIANDWTTGQIIDIQIPEAANNPDGSVYLAWIPTSNLDMNGNEVTAAGTVKIDNIMVYGYENTSVEENKLEANTLCFPNPASSTLTISADVSATGIYAYDISGKLVWKTENPIERNQLNVADLQSGMYIIKVKYTDILVTRTVSVK